jgi:hypothetical protein
LAQGDLPATFCHLYEHILHCLQQPHLKGIDDALKVLRPLHEAFLSIRKEALDLERKGEIQPLGQVKVVQASA